MRNRHSINRQERLAELILFLTLLISYVYVFPRWADPNQNSRLDMVAAVVEDGTFRIDPYVENTVDYAKVGDHYYSDKAPGAAFLGIPFYAGLKVVLDTPLVDGMVERLSQNEAFQATLREEGTGIQKQKVRFAIAQIALTFVVSALPTALLGVLLFRAGRWFTPRLGPRAVAVLVYGLLTPVFAYAGAFYGHQLSAVLLFAAFYLVASPAKPLSTGRLLAAGLLLGYSVVTEYPALLIAAAITVFALYRLIRKGQGIRIVWLGMSAAVVAALWMVYNNAIFGGPLELGYSQSELWQEQHHTGFMSLTLPHWEAVWGITFGGFRGLFFLSPILLLAIPGFVLWWRSGSRRAEFWVAVSSILLTFMFNASSIMWWGGFAVGPRYMLPALPFLALPLVVAFEVWGHQLWFRLTSSLLALWSWIATWGLTLAEQAFPPDSITNPLFEYALPNWTAGNIARNLGTILGLPGIWSLLPLLGFLGLMGAAWLWLVLHPEKVASAYRLSLK